MSITNDAWPVLHGEHTTAMTVWRETMGGGRTSASFIGLFRMYATGPLSNKLRRYAIVHTIASVRGVHA